MTEHAKEPWYCLGTYIHAMRPSGYPLPITRIYNAKHGSPGIEPDMPVEEAEAVARRITVCVNACAGLETAELEGVSIADRLADLGQTLLNTVDQRDAATAQRDEVLAALETLENAARGIDGLSGCSEIAIARDTLKKYRRFK